MEEKQHTDPQTEAKFSISDYQQESPRNFTCSSPSTSFDAVGGSFSLVGTQPIQDRNLSHTSRQRVRLPEP